MNYLRYISLIILLIAVTVSCQKDEIEPVGFYEANYYTSPDSAQSFFYYFDDGELVANGLDEYVVSVQSEAGTFTQEQLLLLKMRSSFEELPDSIIPWTYFLGLNYNDTILKQVKMDFNVDYPFNNYAHQDFYNELFFSSNIDKMKLVKIKYTDPAGLYYNPNYEISNVAFTFIPEESKISFITQETDALYALCWIEQPFNDTLSLQINSGSNTNTNQTIQKGFRNENLQEGAVIKNDILYLDYTPSSYLNETNTDSDGWRFEEIHLLITNPSERIVDHQDIQLDLIITRDESATLKENTRLKLTSNTIVEIIKWPEVGDYGVINFDGFMERESTQTTINIDFNINFKRLR